MKRLSCLVFSLALCGLMQSAVHAQEKKKDDFKVPPSIKLEPKKTPPAVAAVPRPGPSFRHLDGHRILFVANGVGGSSKLSDALIEISSDMHLGLRVQMVPWTRTLTNFGDLADQEARARAAYHLAGLAQCVRRDCPHSPIFFLGHSAGAHVVLQAAALMPEKSIDRVILLHAAVSANYDLKPTFRATRYGVDNFFASQDSVLQTVTDHAMTADGTKLPCAGRIAFRLPYNSPQEKAAYANLRQYRWIEDLCGNGGHYAWLILPNMKKCVVPLLFTLPPPPAPVLVVTPPRPVATPKKK